MLVKKLDNAPLSTLSIWVPEGYIYPNKAGQGRDIIRDPLSVMQDLQTPHLNH